MSLGEKLYFICPSEYAYGKRGAGGVIPPNADVLKFTKNIFMFFLKRLLLKLNYYKLEVKKWSFEKTNKQLNNKKKLNF